MDSIRVLTHLLVLLALLPGWAAGEDTSPEPVAGPAPAPAGSAPVSSNGALTPSPEALTRSPAAEGPGADRTETSRLQPESERIMEVVMEDSTILDEAFIIYQSQQYWFIPLTAFAEKVGFAFSLALQQDQVSGTLGDESRTFRMNQRECWVETRGLARAKFDCNRVVRFQDDYYVDSALLGEWLGFVISIDSAASKVTIDSKTPLPFQLRLERERRAEELLATRQNGERVVPPAPQHRPRYDGPVIDQSLSLEYRSKAEKKPIAYGGYTLFGGQLANWDTQARLRYQTDSELQTSATLEKKDRDARLFGSLKLRQVQAVDSVFPSLPLLNRSRIGLGASLSSYPFEFQSLYSNRDVQGFTRPGWEVELYHNDLYIGRVIADAAGFYSFPNIPLYFGQNRFRIVFYGVQGEKRTEFQTYTIDSSQVRKGDFYYSTSVVRDENEPYAQLRADVGVTKEVTLGTGIATVYSELEKRRYHGVFLQGQTFLSDNQISARAAFQQWDHDPMAALAGRGNGEDEPLGRAFELQWKRPLWAGNLGVTYQRFQDFVSELVEKENERDQRDRLELSTLQPFPFIPGLQFSHSYAHRRNEDGRHEGRYLNRTNYVIGPVNFNHEAGWRLRSYTKLSEYRGTLGANTSLRASDLRGALVYTTEKAEQYLVEWRKSIDVNSNIVLGVQRDLLANQFSANGAATRSFKRWNGTLSASLKQGGEYTVGTQFGFSLLYDPVKEQFRSSGVFVSNRGSVRMKVFLDANGDRRFTDGIDSSLDNVQLRLNSINDTLKTNARGEAFLENLYPYFDQEVTIVLDSLIDPSYQPISERFRFMVRPGSTTTVYVPIQVFGQIEGVVVRRTRSGIENPVPGVRIELQDARHVKVGDRRSDSDGSYWFERLRPGTYYLVPMASEDSALSQFSPEVLPVEVGPKGGFIVGQDFVVKEDEAKVKTLRNRKKAKESGATRSSAAAR